VKIILDYIFNNNLISKSDKIEKFEQKLLSPDPDDKKYKDFYNSLCLLNYNEFILINEFIDGFTPYSTKHGVKGAEFENVLVVIDDKSWNQYNFNEVFKSDQTKKDRYSRTLNLLYVCCSRSKKNLTILALSEIDPIAMHNINSWFGSKNIIDVGSI
jgi:DNA helicase-2/ATP-dependent DNA helicase PcrA